MNIVVKFIFISHIVGVEPVYPVIIFHVVIVGGLIDDLCHQQVERRESHHQPQDVEGCRHLEATCIIDDILEYLGHRL